MLAGNASEPVVVSSVNAGQAGGAVHFLRNVMLFLPRHTVVLYDMGLSAYELDLVRSYCNATCHIRAFDPDSRFPSHTRRISAFRPIIIQDVLRFAGSVLFLSIDQKLITGNLTGPLAFAKAHGGVAAWVLAENRPTSSLTHPNMINLFMGDKSMDLQFQHMVGLEALILYNTEGVRRHLMLPWVKCALMADCVEPIGAQDTGCRFDKKPQYRYSGCHAYDVSALNIVLGQMFGFDESKYICDDQRFFSRISEDKPSLDRASTTSSSLLNM